MCVRGNPLVAQSDGHALYRLGVRRHQHLVALELDAKTLHAGNKGLIELLAEKGEEY